MASSPKEVNLDVKLVAEATPISNEQLNRAWAAREAASVMRARALVSSGTVSPFDVIALADWIATGTQPGGEEVHEFEMETGMAEPDRSDEQPSPRGVAGTDWPGAHVVRLGPGQYAPLWNKLVNSLYGTGTTKTAEQAVSEFLGDLGIRVEVVA